MIALAALIFILFILPVIIFYLSKKISADHEALSEEEKAEQQAFHGI